MTVLNLGAMAVTESYNAPGPLTISRTVVIPPDGTAAASAVLKQADAIGNSAVFRTAAWFTRDEGPIHAGEFLIPARSSVREILAILRFGAPVEHQAIIPEGLTGVQIARLIDALPEAQGNVAPPPEGSVFPQTYDYTMGTNRTDIIARGQAVMAKTLAAAWAGRDPSVPLNTPGQALILASIVQMESPIISELPEIAAVYENRLAMGMKLQADPTVIYLASNGFSAAGAAISRAELSSPSPYNTYMCAGLPPGPIASPGLAAITAVLHPAHSDALYFVATGSGGHVFASNFKDQLAHIAAYRAAVKPRQD